MAKKNRPSSANELLENLREDHNWAPDPVDLTTTGGIQKAIKAQWHAIQALADYIDGKATGMTDDDGKPISDSEAGKSSGVSPPGAVPGPVAQAHAAEAAHSRAPRSPKHA